jgi:hypothetical protein
MVALVKKKNRLMSIDPSINNLGMALWDLGDTRLLLYKLIHPEIGMRSNEFDKSRSMLDQLKKWIQTYKINRMIIEVPEHWAVGGFQARETGSMTKLMFIVGFMYSLVYELDEVKLVTPSGWKGQLPKEVVANRLREHYLPLGVDLSKIDANVADAIEIGHFYIYGKV